MTSERVIARGFGEHSDPAALVVGPTGLALGRSGTLYVADSVGNRIAAVSHALTRHHAVWMGRTVTRNGALNVPLGLIVAPGGDILTVNAGDGRLLETDTARPSDRRALARHVGLAAGLGCALRPGDQAGPPRRLLRGRRDQPARPAALT